VQPAADGRADAAHAARDVRQFLRGHLLAPVDREGP
jgi:hypothetical protein